LLICRSLTGVSHPDGTTTEYGYVTDSADLGELMPAQVQAAAAEARSRGHDSGWSFTLQRPSINPFLQYSPNREMRREIFMGYAMRGDNDNDNSTAWSITGRNRPQISKT